MHVALLPLFFFSFFPFCDEKEDRQKLIMLTTLCHFQSSSCLILIYIYSQNYAGGQRLPSICLEELIMKSRTTGGQGFRSIWSTAKAPPPQTRVTAPIRAMSKQAQATSQIRQLPQLAVLVSWRLMSTTLISLPCRPHRALIKHPWMHPRTWWLLNRNLLTPPTSSGELSTKIFGPCNSSMEIKLVYAMPGCLINYHIIPHGLSLVYHGWWLLQAVCLRITR